MGETLSNIDKILKDNYQDVVREQISVFSPLQEYIEKATDIQWEGRQAVEAAIMNYNEGSGVAIGEGGSLPTAGNFDPQNFLIPMRFVYGQIQLTKQAIDSSKTSKGAFKNVFKTSMETMVKNLKREMARMLFGAGTGVLALVNGASAGTTVTVDSPGGVAGATGGTRYIRKGMILAVHDGTNFRGVRTVTAVASTGLTFTIDSALSVTDNDFITRCPTTSIAAVAGTSYNAEPMGILGLIDDGTYVGTLNNLSRTTYPQLKSRVQSSVGALSLDAIQANFDVAEQMGDANIDVLVCEHAVRRAYLALLESDRRYTGEALTSPDGGTKAVTRKQWVTFGGKPMVTDKHSPYGTLFGVDKTDLRTYVQNEGEWDDTTGAVLKQVSGQDAFYAFYRIWKNYHDSRPNNCFRMDGITANNIFVNSF